MAAVVSADVVSAGVVSADGAGMGSAEIRFGGEAVAMLALSAAAALTGRHRALRMFGLLLAGAALADLAATWLTFPDPAPRARNGCPTADEATIDYWTGRLRLGQLAAALRFGALICLALAVAALPVRPGLRPWHRSVLVTLVTIPAILIGLYPIYAADDRTELLHPTMPGTLLLAAAVTLAVLTVTRTPGGRMRTAALLGGGLLALISSLFAVAAVTGPVVQLRYLASLADRGTFSVCSYLEGTSTTSPTAIAVTAGGVLLALAAPALVVWASPDHR